ncbi:unnamed protein product [Laminaria digitata]
MVRQQKTQSVDQKIIIPPPEHVESWHEAKATLVPAGAEFFSKRRGQRSQGTGGFSSVFVPPRLADAGEDQAPPEEGDVGVCLVGVTYGEATVADAGERVADAGEAADAGERAALSPFLRAVPADARAPAAERGTGAVCTGGECTSGAERVAPDDFLVAVVVLAVLFMIASGLGDGLDVVRERCVTKGGRDCLAQDWRNMSSWIKIVAGYATIYLA